MKLEPIVVGKTTIVETLYNPLDEDALSEMTKCLTESIWSNTSQSKGVSPLHQEPDGQDEITSSLKINSTKPKLVSLKQNIYVKDNCDGFKGLLIPLLVFDDYVLNTFVSKLNPEISKPVRVRYPQTLVHAFNLVIQRKFFLFNLLRNFFIPYKDPLTAPPIQTITLYSSNYYNLQPLLLTPKPTVLIYNQQIMRINGRIKNQLVRLLVGLTITGNLFEQIVFKIWGCGTSTVGGINVNVINDLSWGTRY